MEISTPKFAQLRADRAHPAADREVIGEALFPQSSDRLHGDALSRCHDTARGEEVRHLVGGGVGTLKAIGAFTMATRVRVVPAEDSITSAVRGPELRIPNAPTIK